MQDRKQIARITQAFWQKQWQGRPIVCITAPKNHAAPTGLPTPTQCFTACITGDYAPIFSAFDAVYDATDYAGEAVPHFEVTLGPDQYAGFLGAPITARQGDYTTWAHPCLTDYQGYFSDIYHHGYLQKLLDMMRAAAQHSNGRYLINVPDLHSHLDALSAMRSPQTLCMDLIDYPDEVIQALSSIRKTYTSIYEQTYAAANMGELGTIGWHPIYCTGKSAVLQCDFSCMISPRQAKKFVIDAVAEEAAYLDHSVYHYDGKEALGHLDDILSINDIDVIQWVPGHGQPKTYEWMDLLQKIQRTGKALWLDDWTVEDVKSRMDGLIPERTAFSLHAQSLDEAQALIEYLDKKYPL